MVLLPVLLTNNAVIMFSGQQGTAGDRAASLRSQIKEIETKQVELQSQLQQIEENLKSENIESSLAGVGSTHPEELREQRRRQLDIQRTAVRSQLDQLAKSHTRLENALAQSDADAYRQSALPSAGPSASAASQAAETAAPEQQTPHKKRAKRPKKRHRAKAPVVHRSKPPGYR